MGFHVAVPELLQVAEVITNPGHGTLSLFGNLLQGSFFQQGEVDLASLTLASRKTTRFGAVP
jgi:hypothetical protein